MKKIAFFDTASYDKKWFNTLNKDFEIKYFKNKLCPDTAIMSVGYDAVVAFVNDTINEEVINTLYNGGVGLIAMRCAGYNNVDVKAACGKIRISRVPAYSPRSVAEHAAALLLSLARKTHKAYQRTRDHNFNIEGLCGFDLYGKTVGIVGAGRIGVAFAEICRGFGMRVLAYDTNHFESDFIKFVPMDVLCKESDIISLHCPLFKETYHIINKETLEKMKDGAIIINTSRGELIDTSSLIDALKSGKLFAAGLDVYEEESGFFFSDWSTELIQDDILSLLISLPNVIVTSHQAFLTENALHNIAEVTLRNISQFFSGEEMENELCLDCDEKGTCDNNKIHHKK